MRIDELNTVETSAETWLEFCEMSMASDFYKLVLKRTKNPTNAAALTLLQNYLSTFGKEEQARLEADGELFYKYAEAFINELAPYRYSKEGYNSEVRAAFIGRIRTLLNKQRDAKGNVIDRNKYEFIRIIVKFCSSISYIIQSYDEYKRFIFRDMPQMRYSP